MKPMPRQIGPCEKLPNGTQVNIEHKKGGTVICSRVAANGVVVHTVRITRIYKRGYPSKWVDCMPHNWTGNYSFVYVIDQKQPADVR